MGSAGGADGAPGRNWVERADGSIERLAATGDARAVPLPRPLMGRAGCDFSFSGLKTAVARALAQGAAHADVAASFQAAVAAVLADRARNALGMLPEASAIVVAGGVAANQAVRAALAGVAGMAGVPMLAPPLRLCTDNGAMVAALGAQLVADGVEPSGLDFAADPGQPVERVSLQG